MTAPWRETVAAGDLLQDVLGVLGNRQLTCEERLVVLTATLLMFSGDGSPRETSDAEVAELLGLERGQVSAILRDVAAGGVFALTHVEEVLP